MFRFGVLSTAYIRSGSQSFQDRSAYNMAALQRLGDSITRMKVTEKTADQTL